MNFCQNLSMIFTLQRYLIRQHKSNFFQKKFALQYKTKKKLTLQRSLSPERVRNETKRINASYFLENFLFLIIFTHKLN